MDTREQKQPQSPSAPQSLKPSPSSADTPDNHQLQDFELNQMVASSLTSKLSIIDNLYYKYMNDHYEAHKNTTFKYMHSSLVAGYGILSCAVLLYTKSTFPNIPEFKLMYLAGNVCVMAVLNQFAIERNSLAQNQEMARDYEENNKNYKELLKIKMGRVGVWKKVTEGLNQENVSQYMQYLIR